MKPVSQDAAQYIFQTKPVKELSKLYIDMAEEDEQYFLKIWLLKMFC